MDILIKELGNALISLLLKLAMINRSQSFGIYQAKLFGAAAWSIQPFRWGFQPLRSMQHSPIVKWILTLSF
jgi:hypothetical protein